MSRSAASPGKAAAGRAPLDPFMAAVVLRAWGLDDPRALPHLRAENQPARTYREHAVEQRAIEAGWPQELGFGNEDLKKAMSRAMRRLEGVDFRRGRGSMTKEEVEEEWLVADAAEF
jgi:hypothetical protein